MFGGQRATLLLDDPSSNPAEKYLMKIGLGWPIKKL